MVIHLYYGIYIYPTMVWFRNIYISVIYTISKYFLYGQWVYRPAYFQISGIICLSRDHININKWMSLFTHGCVELLTECCCVSLSDSGGRRHWTPSWENNQDWITARIKRAKPHQLARPSAPPSRALIIRAKQKQKRSERTANARLLCQPARLFQNTSGFQIKEEIPPTARDESGCSFARRNVSQKRRANQSSSVL